MAWEIIVGVAFVVASVAMKVALEMSKIFW